MGQRKQQMAPSFIGVQWPWPNGYYLLLPPIFLAKIFMHLATMFGSINIATFNACIKFIQYVFCQISAGTGPHVSEQIARWCCYGVLIIFAVFYSFALLMTHEPR